MYEHSLHTICDIFIIQNSVGILHINPIKRGSLRVNVPSNIKAYYMLPVQYVLLQLLNSFQICFNLGNCDSLYIIICYYTTRAFHSPLTPVVQCCLCISIQYFHRVLVIPGNLTDTVKLHIYGELCKNVLTIASSQVNECSYYLYMKPDTSSPIFPVQCSYKLKLGWLPKNILQLLESC